MPRLASPNPIPYASADSPILHRGVVSVTGSLVVDTGLGHKNFFPVLSIKGGLTSLAAANIVAWDYGTRPGTFVITVGKATSSSVTTVIASAAAVNVGFIIIAGASV